ncbi:S41 family peptidase [Patescibacteria group bacterium]|nr:S41 family peptidase [Patescibacteria group bacterium]
MSTIYERIIICDNGDVVNMLKKIIYVVVAIALLAGVFAGGAFFGYFQRPAVEKVAGLFNKETPMPANVDFSPFWVAWNEINSKYVSKDNLDDQKRIWGAVQGMVESLGDPYTVFFPPQESKMFQENISGDFEGVGMEIAVRKGVLMVVSPLKGTPAEKAGIKAGDKILKIDDTTTADITADQAAQLIRGPRGTQVKLTILRDDQDKSMEIIITRDVIKIPVLDTETKSGGIFVIKLYNFSGNSASAFRNALREFINSGKNKLILDLRNNPGGYLELAVENSSWFLPTGKVVVREQFANGDEELYRSKGYDIFENLPMVILINEGSASASEIMAGALQEHGIAKLVGEKTFGKGSVQELVQITPDTSLKITIAKWLTPNGRSISDEGLEPDVEVELTEEDFEAGRDPQMDKAMEIISSQ